MLLSVLLGVSWFFMFIIMEWRHGSIYSGMRLFMLCLSAVPETSAAVLVLCMVFRLAPFHIRRFFINGIVYTDGFVCSDGLHGRFRSPLASSISMLTIVEVLGLSTLVFVFGNMQIDAFAEIPEAERPAEWEISIQLAMLLFSVGTVIGFVINNLILVYVVFPVNRLSRVAGSYFSQNQSGRAHSRRMLSCQKNNALRIHGEIRMLYDSFAKMMEDMEKERQLELDLVKSQSESSAKSNFLSSMSHEIRTPINAVLGLDEMILRESREPVIKGYARDIQSSGKTLLSLVNDILDFSKIEAGKLDIICADYDLRATISDLATMVEGRAAGKGLSFMIAVDISMPHLLYGDEVRIKQCVLNILTNAVKYTPYGSVELSVGGRKTDDGKISLRFRIKDTGIGIRSEDIERLYKPFERFEEDGRNRHIEGTGLGLSIVNGLLAQMGSRLEVQSEYGKGSEFSFAVVQEVKDWEPIGTREQAREALLAQATAYEESFQAPNAKILVVDDTPMNLTVIKGLLKDTRIQIDTADSAAEGLEKARHKAYNLMFIDHLMPKMDGIEMLKALKADASSLNRDTVCVVLTANAVSGAKERYLAEGFTEYLTKPVDSAKLEKLLRTMLPKELVLHKGDAGYEEKPAWDGVERRSDRRAGDDLLSDIFALDIGQGMRSCGGKDTYKEAVRNFWESIPENAQRIENAFGGSDWKNYTILVHALKSSARLVGAMELSQSALELEAAGNSAQSGDSAAIAAIQERTAPLLAAYRAYRERLVPMCVQDWTAASVCAMGTAVAAKPAMTETQFSEALSSLREAAAAFDFDSADVIVKEIDGYEVPADAAALWQQVRNAVRDVDTAKILSLLEEQKQH